MVRRLTLHIGSHKTGTTTVQETFRQNSALLQRSGISYVGGQRFPNLHEFLGFVKARHMMPDGFKVQQPAKLVAALTAAPGPHVVGSSENFSFFFHAEPIAELAALLRPHFDEIRILAYLRRQDRQAVSHHQEGAKPMRRPEAELWGHSLTTLPEPLPHQALYLDYDRRIGFWAQEFGKDAIDLRVFDRQRLASGDIVTDVLQVLGVTGLDLRRSEDRNTSLSGLQAKLGHAMNAAGVSEALALSLLVAAGNGPPSRPSQSDARAFLARWREGNARLNARLGASDAPWLFDDNFDDYPAEAEPAWDLPAAEHALGLAIHVLGGQDNPMSGLHAEDLRDAAVALRQKKPEAALRMIRAAGRLRPQGKLIHRLLAEIEADVEAAKTKAPAAGAGDEER